MICDLTWLTRLSRIATLSVHGAALILFAYAWRASHGEMISFLMYAVEALIHVVGQI